MLDGIHEFSFMIHVRHAWIILDIIASYLLIFFLVNQLFFGIEIKPDDTKFAGL